VFEVDVTIEVLVADSFFVHRFINYISLSYVNAAPLSSSSS